MAKRPPADRLRLISGPSLPAAPLVQDYELCRGGLCAALLMADMSFVMSFGTLPIVISHVTFPLKSLFVVTPIGKGHPSERAKE
jgi:hypothetical protein